MRLGVRSIRAEAVDLEPVDIRFEKMAERAEGDEEYQKMIRYIEEGTKPEEMDQTSELFTMNGERQYLGTVRLSNGCKLIVKNEDEVLIPEEDREEILAELHSTHLSSQSMKKLARGRITWKAMNKQIERIYESCESCLVNARAKPHRNNARCEVIPASLSNTLFGTSLNVASSTQTQSHQLLYSRHLLLTELYGPLQCSCLALPHR